MIGIKFYSLNGGLEFYIMGKRSFEHGMVKGIVENIAESKINNRPFNLINFRTALKMIEDRCWDYGITITIEYDTMEIGVISCYPCGLIVRGFFYEGEHKAGFRILYEQSTGTMRFLKDLYKTQF